MERDQHHREAGGQGEHPVQLGLALADRTQTEADAARAIVKARPDLFTPEFETWLLENWAIWKAFERRADRLWNAGQRHAGARMIGETIRYLTSLRERDTIFKVNDHAWPNCARLYMQLHRERTLFETRSSEKRMRAA